MSKDAASLANEFIPVFATASQAATRERERIRTEIDRFESQRDELNEKIEALTKELQEIDHRVAVALKVAAREAGVKLELGNGQSAAAAAAPKPTQKRIPTAELEAIAKRVLGALPANGKKFISQGDVAHSTNIDGQLVQKALSKLKREGRAVSNGKRGRQGGWQKA